MSRLARAEVFAPDEIAIMHLISRVVRRCFLPGDDPVSKKNIDHRKVWIEVRLQQLAASFGIDLLALSCHGWWGGLQSEHYDARYQGIVTIEYPLHPLFGRQFNVARRIRCGRRLFFEVHAGGNHVTVPEWMTRKDACSHLRCGVDPVCDFHALRAIQAILDANGL